MKLAWRHAASMLAAVMLAGCTGPLNFMHGVGPDARDTAWFGWLVSGIFCLAAVAVWALLIVIVRRRRGSFASHEPLGRHDGRAWIVVGGVLLPVAVFGTLYVLMFDILNDAPHHALQADDQPEIRIVGQQWWFDAHYLGESPVMDVHVPTEIHIPTGRPVEIELQTRDVIHSFWVPKLHGKIDLVPGMPNRVFLRADEPGRYAGQCSEFCGLQHAHMRFAVIAQPPDDYAAWLAHQRSGAESNLTDATAAHGSEVFQAAACPLCHTVRGTPARGSIGPDLTHVGSRQRIAGGMLDNNASTLAAWIVNAQGLKPGAQMPSLREALTPQELQALVAYLQSLQ